MIVSFACFILLSLASAPVLLQNFLQKNIEKPYDLESLSCNNAKIFGLPSQCLTPEFYFGQIVKMRSSSLDSFERVRSYLKIIYHEISFKLVAIWKGI